MNDYQMGVIESRFADIIWGNEPISSTELARRSGEVLGWKKSTAYTVLKRLCEKGIFRNENGIVSSVVSKNEFNSLQSEKFVNDTFDGSLPAFLAAFTSRKTLTKDEVEHLRLLVAKYEEE